MTGAYIIVGWVAIMVFCIVRCEVAYRMSMKALAIDLYAFEHGPSFTKMELQVWKWTFRQFYPELAARAQS
jgi:hypothetical protein